MDTIIHDAWDDLKEANHKKRRAQKQLRKQRSRSTEQLKEYHRMKDELAKFHSNEEGYVEKS